MQRPWWNTSYCLDPLCLPTGWFYGSIFSTEVSFLQMTLGLCQVDKELAITRGLGDDAVGKVFAVQSRRPEFWSPVLTKKAEKGEAGRSLGLLGQLVWFGEIQGYWVMPSQKITWRAREKLDIGLWLPFTFAHVHTYAHITHTYREMGRQK